jgi:hypothetical protein
VIEAVGYARFVRVQLTPEETHEMARVDELAAELREDLANAADKIAQQHVHRAAAPNGERPPPATGEGL